MPNPILIGCLSCALAGTVTIAASASAASATKIRDFRWCNMAPPNFCWATFSPTVLPTPVAGFAGGGSDAFHHDGLNFAGATAAESGSLVVFRRRETRHALLERRKFDHN